MAKTIEIRPLARDDDRGDFSCGQPELDRLFEHYAGQNQFKLHLAVTYVAVIEGRMVGFVTVAASSIERENLPNARLRKKLPACPLPVLRLARLGIDMCAQGLGIGRGLVRLASPHSDDATVQPSWTKPAREQAARYVPNLDALGAPGSLLR